MKSISPHEFQDGTESMDGRPVRTRRPTLPWGLAGMLVLVVGVEMFITRNKLDLIGGLLTWEWSLSGKEANRRDQGREILCFGSSVSSYGIVPRLIRQQVGKRTFNFAICAGPPAVDFFLLRRALAAGSRPSAVVVDFHPGPLGTDLRHPARCWSHLLTTRECLELSWAARDASFFAETVLGVNLPSIRNRLAIRAAIAAALRGESSSLRHLLLGFERNKQVNEGSVVPPPVSGYDGDIGGARIMGDLLPDTWAPHPVGESYARRFVELAASNKIPVFWVIPPFVPRLQEEREAKGLETSYVRFARSMLDRYPNLSVVSASRSGYPVAAFQDAGHLNRLGAIAFSSDLSAVLRARLDCTGQGQRWIDLPSFRDPNIAIPIEDLAHSIGQVQLRTLRR